MAEEVGRGGDVSAAQPRPGGLRPRQAPLLLPRHVPLSLGRGPARRPPRGLHRHRHPLALQADARIQRPSPDGLGRLRPARRAVRHQDRRPSRTDHQEVHRQLPPPAPALRLLLRLEPRARHHRPGLLPLDTVDLRHRSTSPTSTPTRRRRVPSRRSSRSSSRASARRASIPRPPSTTPRRRPATSARGHRSPKRTSARSSTAIASPT